MGEKKKLALIILMIITLVLGILGIRSIYLSVFSKTIANIASDFKKIDFNNNKFIIIRTLSQESTSGTWLSGNKKGNGYALNLSSMGIVKVNSVKGVAGKDIVILGTYNGFIYIYQTNKGINKIKDGKSYNIVAYPNPTFRLFKNYLLYSVGKYNSINKTNTETIYLMNLNDGHTTKIYEYSKNEYNNEYGSVQDFQIIDNNVIAIQISAVGGSKPVQLYDFSGTIIDLGAADSRTIAVSYDRKCLLTTDWPDGEYFGRSYDIKTRQQTRLTDHEYYKLLYNINESVMAGNISLLELLSRYGTPVEKDKDLYNVLFDSSDKMFFQSSDYYRIYSVDKKTGEKIELFNADKYKEKINNVYMLSK